MSTSRYAVAARLAATQTFINVPTTLTTLVALPLTELLMLVAVASAMHSPQLVLTAYCGALVASATGVLTQTIGLVTYDRNIGVLHDVLLTRFFNPVFWFSKLAIPCFNAALMGCVIIGGIWLFAPASSASPALVALAMLPCFILAGALLGFTCATLSVALNDPYLISNVVAATLPLTTAVLAPVSAYPAWLAALIQWLPLTHGIEVFRDLVTGSTLENELLFHAQAELAICCTWALAGVLASSRILTLIRSGRRRRRFGKPYR